MRWPLKGTRNKAARPPCLPPTSEGNAIGIFRHAPRVQTRRAISIFAALLLFVPCADAASPLLKEIIAAHDLICEFHASDTLPGKSRSGNPRSLMVFLENVEAQRARLVSSATVGSRPVRVYSGDTGVHFVEDVQSSVKVTSLLSCTRWKDGAKGRQCVRYDAVNRWHFDTSVHRNADEAYLRLAENSYTGWCEPWRID